MEQNTVLRTALKGYHKMQVLVLVDGLNALILAAESGDMPREEAIKEAEALLRKPIQKAFGGFRTEDVDAQFAALLAKLKGETK
ncbi:MAG: hypothetical protein II341_08635 [Oscillospiraceae bacterium]|nr:hypothetical protein [Oscillospiraceae bacterium]